MKERWSQLCFVPIAQLERARRMSLKRTEIRELFRRHGPALVLYARQWCCCPDDAVQEAFIELLNVNTPPDSPVAWLFKVAQRKALNLSRSERRRINHQEAASRDSDRWFDVQLEHHLELEEVELALQELSDSERQIVVSKIWGELSFEQIAGLTDLSSSAVHRHFHRAIAKLSTLLGRVNTP